MAILTCKQTCECISLQIFSKYLIQISRDRTKPPPPPNFESLPFPRCRWQVRNFFAKMKGKDELEGTRSNFTPWLCDFEHQGENCQGGWYNPPLGELGLKQCITACVNKSASLKEHFFLGKLYVSFEKVYNKMIGNIISFYRIFVLCNLDVWFRNYGKSCEVPPNLFGLIHYHIHHW